MSAVARVPQRTVLVVDDDRKIVQLVRAYLERDGHRVVAAHDGRAALATFEAERPDLVVLDLMLPELDGYEVCRRIRAEDDTPILMLTARSSVPDRDRRHDPVHDRTNVRYVKESCRGGLTSDGSLP